MKAWVWGVAAAFLVATAAVAGTGIEEGNAGLDALNSGDYDGAIRHFTLALKPGALAGEDREFAYLNRGKAYAAKGDYEHAIADLRMAVRLKPDDDDAKAALQDALAAQGGGGGGSSGQAASAAPAPSGGGSDYWGMLSGMVTQQYYWYQMPGQDPHAAYTSFTWIASQQTLSAQTRSKSGPLLVTEYMLEAKTGQVIYAGMQQGVAFYGTVKATPASTTAYGYEQGKALRVIERRQPDGSITEVEQSYIAGGWANPSNVTLAPTTPDELIAAGLMKAPKKRK